jgi:hypothetical protein
MNKYLLASLAFSIAIVGILKHSGTWMLGAFVPPALMKFTDYQFEPYGEIESFYKYVDEKRRAQHVFKKNHEVTDTLKNYNPELFEKVKSDLEKSNKTVYDVVADLDEMYLKAALKH